MKKIIEQIKKKQEIILYLVFGVCTTVINILSYFSLRFFEVNVFISGVISWIVSVLFAYVTNKIFVFRCKKNTAYELLKEFLSFGAGRLFTGAVDVALLVILVDKMALYEPPVKIFSNILVIVLNYIISKLWIFRTKK